MPGQIPDQTIDEISQRTNILDVVGSYVHLSRKGHRWWGLCPFHNEKTSSFTVTPDTNLYYCFGCHQGGNVYQFVMEMEGLSFPEAIRHLAEKTGVEIPEEEGDVGLRDRIKTLESLYQRVSTTFHWLLLNHPDAESARQYLTKRGISDETAECFRLGWAPADSEWLYRFLSEKSFSPEFLGESGLFRHKSSRKAFFVNRLMFPIMPDSRRVVAFSGRALSQDAPKYINSPETPIYKKSQQLFGLGQARDAIRRKRSVILCEGNMDVLSCFQAGFEETVAPLGTSFTEEQANVLKRRAEGILILFDGDPPGRAATMKAAVIAEQFGLSVTTVGLPSGEDPAEILEKQGAETLKKLLRKPINIFSYLLDFLISAKPSYTGEAQEEALKELIPYLNAVGSDIRREAYLRELAERIKADPATVAGEYRRLSSAALNTFSRPAARPTQTVSTPISRGEIGDELYLMTAVAVRTEYFSTLRKLLAPEVLRDRQALSVYRVLDELATQDEIPRTDAVLARLDDDELIQFIVEKAASGVYQNRVQETIAEKVRMIKTRVFHSERQELVNGLSRADRGHSEITDARIKRIQEIDREILKIRQGENGGNQD